MFDSDVDSWYDWKGGDDINEMYKTRSGTRPIGSDRTTNFPSDEAQKESSRTNGLVHCNGIPTSSRSDIHRYINPAIYAEKLNDDEVEQEVEICVKISSKDGRVIANRGDTAEMNDTMSTLSINNDLAASCVDHAGDQCSTQDTYRCYSLNSPTTSASVQSGVARSKSVTSCRASNRVERRCRIADRTENNDELCSSRQIDSEVQRYSAQCY